MTDQPNVLKFVPRQAPAVQDPWAELFEEHRRWVKQFTLAGFALIGGTLLGVAAALEKMK